MTGTAPEESRRLSGQGDVLNQAFGANCVVGLIAYRQAVGPAAPEGGGAAEQLSSPSGHVSATEAGMTAYAAIFAMRRPRGRPVPWGVGAADGVTGLTALGRVLGDTHF